MKIEFTIRESSLARTRKSYRCSQAIMQNPLPSVHLGKRLHVSTRMHVFQCSLQPCVWQSEIGNGLISISRRWDKWMTGMLSHSAMSSSSDPVYYSFPGSSVHGIFQARILEWVDISSSRGSSQPRDRTWVSCVSCRKRSSFHCSLFNLSNNWFYT